MRRLIYTLVIFILIGGIVLTSYAPDNISTVFIVIMECIVLAGVVLGILPVVAYYRAFETGLNNIERALEVQTSSTWSVMSQIEDFFHQRTLDGLFRDYREKVQVQRESGQALTDIEDYINEDILALRSWQNVVLQIPGTLTGLGILGTFIGLLIGIRGIGFSSIDIALTSVQTLLSGIQVAFYTSIAGMILSLMFNIIYRISWNMLRRNLGLFTEEFHKNVIPPVGDQVRYREQKELKQITELLERLPKNTGFSASGQIGSGAPASADSNEQILMPQILEGMRSGEFVFYLQTKHDLNTRKVIGGEALVRWNHGKLGTVSPAVFIPILEKNGYITKLDQYIWESVFATIRRWIDNGVRPMPLAINATKTDILAMDLAGFMEEMLKKYRIPPRYLEVEIAENAYLESPQSVLETEEKLRQLGFRVIMDGFNGDYISLSTIDRLSVDVLKLDLRRFDGRQNQGALNAVFEQARKININVAVEGIESMEQLTMLRRCGCSEGQGFYLSRPIPAEEFEKQISGESKQ